MAESANLRMVSCISLWMINMVMMTYQVRAERADSSETPSFNCQALQLRISRRFDVARFLECRVAPWQSAAGGDRFRRRGRQTRRTCPVFWDYPPHVLHTLHCPFSQLSTTCVKRYRGNSCPSASKRPSKLEDVDFIEFQTSSAGLENMRGSLRGIYRAWENC